MRLKNCFLFALILLTNLSLTAQTVSLLGNVKEKGSANSLCGASVYIEGSTQGCASDSKGDYLIKNLKTGQHTLIASFSGYITVRKAISLKEGENIINFELEENLKFLDEIVVTGTGTHYKLDDVPVQTEIITKKDIEEISGRNLEEIISNISSSFDYTSSSMGTNIKLNGLGDDFVLLLLNGKRLTGGIGGYTDLSRIDFDNIKQVEIIKGASSTLYGSDAIAGVINIITKKSKQKLEINSHTRIGAYGELKQFNSLSFRKNKLLSKTTYSHKRTDGWQLNNMEYNSSWEDNHDLPYLVLTYDKPVNKSRGYTITQNLEYDVNKKLSLNADLSWYEKTLYFPFRGRMHNYYYNNRSIDLGGNYKLKNKNYIDFNITFGNYLYYTEYPYKYNETYTTASDVISVTYYPGDRFKNSEQITINAQAKGVFYINTKNKLSLGFDVLSNYLEAQYRLNKPSADALTYSVYGQDEIKIGDKIDVVLGLRTLYHDISGFSVTPKISTMYKEKGFTYRFTYSSGFKSPTLKELYYYYESNMMGVYRLYLGNEDLKPQRSHYFSLSTEYKHKKFQTSLNLYLNRLYDMIDFRLIETDYYDELRGIEETKKRYNIDDARTCGIDYQIRYKFSSHLSLNAGYSYVDARNLTEDIRLNGVSAHSANFKASWTKAWHTKSLNLNLTGVYKSNRFYIDEDLEKSYAKAYQLFKFTANYKIRKFKKINWSITGGVDNIFDYVDDSPYGSHYGTLNPGRSVFVGIKLNFSNKNK
ncbi:TonB-dependent receptor [Ancylomarina sp. 16SWW S1-10-2]|uniref:TonB-dependent receptor n=1 Tax=Ancylomarina sp. 16SWW S1-10-2 TaxID=2499681 RepID=UPI0012AE9FC8|nr:TonB-dependent receptor [Ancylomarina sp. 16SWW S1-10-2]MRT93834.1 TonB-dependent receptor [Ancylomarina sp. 16SWW S1-10-2]